MRDSSKGTGKRRGIPCLEVLISNRLLEKSGNLFWTLSVYSLENQPVNDSRSVSDSKVFRFMLFDWERTLKTLLDKNDVPYAIIQRFTADTPYGAFSPATDFDYIRAAQRLENVSPSGQDTCADYKPSTADSLL